MNYKGLESTKKWFEQAIPEPTQDHRTIQLGCHAEEFGEMLDSLDLIKQSWDVDNLATSLKCGQLALCINNEALLDSLADQVVTAVGVAHMFGMDILGALEEVNRSNFSKFEDGKPVFDENGKIGKGKYYIKPNLKPYI